MTETETESTSLAPLYLKMAAVMGHLERVPKRGVNEHFRYAYVTDSDVLDAVRKAMALERVAFFVDIDELMVDNKRTTVRLSLTFADGDTGAAYTIQWFGEALDSQDKGINKAVTAGVKYCLLKTFLMSTGEDDDPDGSKPPAKKAQPKRQPRPTAQKPTQQPSRKRDDLEPTPHWIEDPAVRARFWAWTSDTLELDGEQVHTALGVESVKDYAGTMGEAKTAILNWNAKRKGKEEN